jgi:hypothetical protein
MDQDAGSRQKAWREGGLPRPRSAWAVPELLEDQQAFFIALQDEVRKLADKEPARVEAAVPTIMATLKKKRAHRPLRRQFPTRPGREGIHRARWEAVSEAGVAENEVISASMLWKEPYRRRAVVGRQITTLTASAVSCADQALPTAPRSPAGRSRWAGAFSSAAWRYPSRDGGWLG